MEKKVRVSHKQTSCNGLIIVNSKIGMPESGWIREANIEMM
jgi:hypothetical protein